MPPNESSSLVVVTAGLSDSKLADKLVGLRLSEKVSGLILIRRRPLSGLAGVRNLSPSGFWACNRLTFELWRWWTVVLTARNPDVIAVVGIQMLLHGCGVVACGLLVGKASVVSVIGNDIHVHPRSWWKRVLISWALRRADCVAMQGERSAARCTKLGADPRKLVELQNVLDGARFKPVPIGHHTWEVIFVGELLPVKNLEGLMDAWAIVRQQFPTGKLAVVGEGPERPALEARIRDLEVDDSVCLLGHRRDVGELLPRARVFVMSSHSEGLPAAALEAAACGLPVILPDVGDVGRAFGAGLGVLVPPGDPHLLAAAIVEVLKDRTRYRALQRNATKVREDYLNTWNPQGQSARWTKILDVATGAAA